jgi:hypothetical protein
MTEKKIDLSNVKVGGKLWTIQEGDTECQRVDNDDQPIVTSDDEYFMLDGKKYDDDKYPSCYHSYQEFLEFHNIAPVRMTRNELLTHIKNIMFDDVYSVIKHGFLLAGGQIIEEPKHLPCMLCGVNVEQKENGIVYHNDNGCILSDHNYSGTYWDDPSKRGGKIG